MSDARHQEPTSYRLQHARDALAQDDRVGALDIRIEEVNGKAVLTGVVPTAARRAAIGSIVRELLPDMPLHNAIDVEELAPPHDPEILS
jgi:hypothetical protein